MEQVGEILIRIASPEDVLRWVLMLTVLKAVLRVATAIRAREFDLRRLGEWVADDLVVGVVLLVFALAARLEPGIAPAYYAAAASWAASEAARALAGLRDLLGLGAGAGA
ncbi:MAG: hypothetical protein LOD90_10770, partial [Symbiobacteriaceae bacterium]